MEVTAVRALPGMKGEHVPLLLGVAGVAAAYLLVRLYGSQTISLPVAVLLVPVMAVALWAGPWATGTVAVLAAAAGTQLFLTTTTQADVHLRYGALILGCTLATALSGARRRRDEAIAEHRAELTIARRREDDERRTSRMLERLPELSGARSIDDVTDRACRIARDLFGADAVSYWQLDGPEAVLLSRDPAGRHAPGMRIPRALLHPWPHLLGESHTSWARLASLTENDPRRPVMLRSGAAAGASTPVRVDFTTVGILALSWAQDRPDPDAAWLARLERFADQTALAKTVVRRRLAQQESRDLSDRLQASFMPAEVQDVPNAVIRLLYRPGLSQMLMGGDFLDVTTTPGGGTAFLIGDVSGHGPEQAALAAVVRAAWRGALSVPRASLPDWVVALESVVQDRRPSEGLFVTVVTGYFDADMEHMDYIGAGHPPPLLLPSCTPLPLGGPPLGFGPLVRFSGQDVHTVTLGRETGVLLVTDGLFEGFTEPGSRRRVGYDSFVELVREQLLAAADDSEFLTVLADRLERMNGGPLSDDAAALLIVRRRGERAASSVR